MISPSKPYAPACDRNRDPILQVLRRHFTDRRHVLEIGSGTGQHAVYFAAALPHLLWQPADVPANLPGIRMWCDDASLPNLAPPLALDVNVDWPASVLGSKGFDAAAASADAALARYDAAFSANTLHIMSWQEVQKLFAGVGDVLTADALLAIYGPFNYGGRFTSASNAAFDASLKERSPSMGIRDFAAVDELARARGFQLVEDDAMPANNRTLVWKRGSQ